VAPEVVILKALYNGEALVIKGQISEYIDNLYINGNHVNLGEYPIVGKPIPFDYVTFDPNISELNIEAADGLGNQFTSIINLKW
jgi:hypothetical protein